MDVKAIATAVGKPENIAFGQQVADSAITLVRDNGKVIPLKSKGTAKGGLPYMTKEETHNQVLAVIFSDDVRTESGRAFGREFRARIPDARVIYVDPRFAAGMSDEVLKAVDEAQTVVGAVYVIPTAGKVGNSVAMADATGTLLQQMLDHAAGKTAIVAMGNPYLASDFPEDRKLHVYVLQCDRFGSGCDQSALRRDSDSRPSARNDPECCAARRRDGASGASRGGRDLIMRRTNLQIVRVLALGLAIFSDCAPGVRAAST